MVPIVRADAADRRMHLARVGQGLRHHRMGRPALCQGAADQRDAWRAGAAARQHGLHPWQLFQQGFRQINKIVTFISH